MYTRKDSFTWASEFLRGTDLLAMFFLVYPGMPQFSSWNCRIYRCWMHNYQLQRIRITQNSQMWSEGKNASHFLKGNPICLHVHDCSIIWSWIAHSAGSSQWFYSYLVSHPTEPSTCKYMCSLYKWSFQWQTCKYIIIQASTVPADRKSVV